MKRIAVIAALMLLAFPANAAEKKPEATFSVGYNYSKGDYGQVSDTTVHYVPSTLKVKWDEWTVKIVVPWLRITGPGVVVGDAPVGTPRPVGTESGLGDVTASLAWTKTVNTKGTTIELTGISKIPTADEDRRLGTGLFDFTAQGGVIQPIGKAFLTANVGRKFNGDNGTFPLKDVWKWTAGGGYKIFEKTTIGALYDYRGAQATGGDPLKLATGFISHDFNDGWSAQLYASAGFSDASPDGAIGFQLNKAFTLF